jgi:multidrug efflux pump
MIAVEMMARKIEEGWDRCAPPPSPTRSTAFPDAHRHADHRGRLPADRDRASRPPASTPSRSSPVVTIALLMSWVAAVASRPSSATGRAQGPQPAAIHEVFDTRFYRRLRALIDWCMRTAG